MTVYGDNFGPSTDSGEGPIVTVDIDDVPCDNVTVVNDTVLTCISPPLLPGSHNFTLTVDEVAVTEVDGFNSLDQATVESISPDSTYRFTPTQVVITGTNFGPTTDSEDANPLSVFLISEFNITECTDPIVLVEDSVLTCLALPNLGPSNISVVVDGVVSLPSDVTFFHYDDAGNFSFEVEEFLISETELYANVSVIRHDYPPFASPANVSIWAFDRTAVSGTHFEATNQTAYVPYMVNTVIFQIRITAAAFQPERLLKRRN